MSKRVNAQWRCPACACNNKTIIIKPTPSKSSASNEECENCYSGFRIVFSYAFGNLGSVFYKFLEINLSEKGSKEMEKLNKAQTGTNKTKGKENGITGNI